MMKYYYLLAATLLIFSCTDQDSLPENQYATHKIQLNEKEYIQIEGDGINYEVALEIAATIQSNIATSNVAVPVDKETYKSPEELSFTEFPWWEGSYYWENFQDLNIQYQTYTTAFIEAQSGWKMTVVYQRSLDKKDVPMPFFKWQYYDHTWTIIEDGVKYDQWIMTCMRARLYGTKGELNTETGILADEIRKFEKMECSLDNEGTRDWVNYLSN